MVMENADHSESPVFSVALWINIKLEYQALASIISTPIANENKSKSSVRLVTLTKEKTEKLIIYIEGN